MEINNPLREKQTSADLLLQNLAREMMLAQKHFQEKIHEGQQQMFLSEQRATQLVHGIESVVRELAESQNLNSDLQKLVTELRSALQYTSDSMAEQAEEIKKVRGQLGEERARRVQLFEEKAQLEKCVDAFENRLEEIHRWTLAQVDAGPVSSPEGQRPEQGIREAVRSLKHETEQSRTIVQTLRGQLARIHHELEEKDQVIQRLQVNLEALALEKTQSTSESLIIELRDIYQRNEEHLRHQVEELQEGRRRLQDELGRLHDQYNSRSVDVFAPENQDSGRLLLQLSVLHDENQRLKSELAEITGQSDFLRHQLENANETLRQEKQAHVEIYRRREEASGDLSREIAELKDQNLRLALELQSAEALRSERLNEESAAIQALKSERHQLQLDKARVDGDLRDALAQVVQSEQHLVDMDDEIRNLRTENAAAQIQVKEVLGQLEIALNEKFAALNQVVHFQRKFTEATQQIESLRNENQQTTEDLRQLEEQSRDRVQALQVEIEDRTAEVGGLIRQVEERNAEIRELKTKNLQADHLQRELQEKLSRVLQEKQIELIQARAEADRLLMQKILDFEEGRRQWQSETEILKSQLQSLNSRLQEVQADRNQVVQELRVELSEARVQSEDRALQLSEQTQHLRDIENQLKQAMESLAVAEKVIHDLRDQLAAAQSENGQFRQDAQRRNEEQQALRERVSQLNIALAAEQTKVQEQLSGQQEALGKLRSRQDQLATYAGLVNHSKSEVRLTAEKLVAELQMMRGMNPLNDYLQVTQREIARVEAMLLKTPTISSDRPRLEQSISELIEQREYLRGIIQKSQHDMDVRVARLQKLAGQDSLVFTPPPPPPL